MAKSPDPDPVKPDFGPFFPDPVAKNPSGTPLVSVASQRNVTVIMRIIKRNLR